MKGFTLIEIMLVGGIIMILAVISSLTLVMTIGKTSLTAATNVVIADMVEQQTKAMTGDTNEGVVPVSWG